MLAEPPVTTLPRRRLADDLRAAIEGGEVELRYQPQVAMADGRVTGVEVLARWQHPKLGELGAERLFAAASRAGMSLALSQHIHGAALTEVTAWPASLRRLDVALNATASDLARAGFADELLARASIAGIAPERLTIELTEHEPITDLTAASAVLAALREAGVRVALDDFGTGHSQIGYLKALPLDYLKLDAAWSADLMGTDSAPIVVRHVIALARALGLLVVAEGVEREEQRRLLKDAGATHFQGFLFAPPLTGSALAALVSALHD